jgi:hypothetical protein
MAIVVTNTASNPSQQTGNPLTTNEVLDLALGKQHDTSTGLRTKALAWLNETMQKLHLERDWLCLERTVGLTAADSAIPKPADYGRFRYARCGDFFIGERHRLSEEDVHLSAPIGFFEDATHIRFAHDVADTVTLGYACAIPTYGDNATTVLDAKFKNLLARSVQTAVYEYEKDQRAISSIQLDEVLLNKLKAEENRQRPTPKRSKYLRGRR